MYVHPAFRMDRAASLAHASERGFGLVVACRRGAPVGSPVPFVLSYGSDGEPRLSFHVARANRLAELAAHGGTWLMAISGPDAYVSPDWYASRDQVPTWLYRAVHLSGPVKPMTEAECRAHLDELSAKFEAWLAPKPPWRAEQVAPGRRAALEQAILGITMRIETVEGSAKLNQHKSDADLSAVAAALAQGDAAALEIAREMRALRPHLTDADAAPRNGPVASMAAG